MEIDFGIRWSEICDQQKGKIGFQNIYNGGRLGDDEGEYLSKKETN